MHRKMFTRTATAPNPWTRARSAASHNASDASIVAATYFRTAALVANITIVARKPPVPESVGEQRSEARLTLTPLWRVD